MIRFPMFPPSGRIKKAKLGVENSTPIYFFGDQTKHITAGYHPGSLYYGYTRTTYF